MNQRVFLSEVRVFVLRNRQVTGATLKFQYYPTVIFNPKLGPFVDEMRRQLKLEGRDFWMYCLDPAASRLVLINSPGYSVPDDVFFRFINYGAVRVFVEIERQLQEHELSFVLPTIPGIRSINDLRRDRSTDEYTKFTSHIMSIREQTEAIFRGTSMYSTYLHATTNKARSMHTGVACDNCGGCVSGLLEKCVECGCKLCAKCIPIMNHQRIHRNKTIFIAYPNGVTQLEAPNCKTCGIKVSPLYYIDKRSFYTYCNEHGELMIAHGEALPSDLVRIHCGAIFKYQDIFLKLKREFMDVPDERIKHLLWLNEGCEANVRCVLNSKFRLTN